MLWGCVVSQGRPYAVAKTKGHEMLFISHAALAQCSDMGKTHLMLNHGKDAYAVAVLQRDKAENSRLNLYVHASQNIVFTVYGQGEVHVTGFFKPAPEPELQYNPDSDSDSGSSSEEAYVERPLAKLVPPVAAQPRQKPGNVPQGSVPAMTPALKLPLKAKKPEVAERHVRFEDLVGSSEEKEKEKQASMNLSGKRPLLQPLPLQNPAKKAKSEPSQTQPHDQSQAQGQGADSEKKHKKKKKSKQKKGNGDAPAPKAKNAGPNA